MGFRESFTTEWLSVYTWQILLDLPVVCALRELICADESQNICVIHLVHVFIYCERESPSVVSNYLQPHGLYSPWNSPGQNTGIGSCFLLPGIFPTQGSNRGLPHCRRILYQLNHEGGPLNIVLVIMFYVLRALLFWKHFVITLKLLDISQFILHFCISWNVAKH